MTAQNKKLGWITRIQHILKLLWEKHNILNAQMKDSISDGVLALVATAIVMVVLAGGLFISPYLGLGNDSAVLDVMESAGLEYQPEDAQNGNLYFTRQYQVVRHASFDSAHTMLISIARWVDYAFTNDTVFDVRMLGMIYAVLFLPAFYIMIYAALARVHGFTEKVAVVGLGILIFSDISYIAYFNSLYSEGLIYICLLYIFGAAMSLQRQQKNNTRFYVVIVIATTLLSFTRRHCYIVSIVMGVFCYFQIRLKKTRGDFIKCILFATMLILVGLIGKTWMKDDFDQSDQFHAMTRGVLLQASNPVKALGAFGINPSYSMLTDASLYFTYPIARLDDPLIQDGFLNQYSKNDIVLYYSAHPGTAVGMLDLAVKASYQRSRNNCGNYERSVGMPKMAKSIYMSIYSNFKIKSMPRTIGYIVLLIACYTIMAMRRLKVRGKIVVEYYVYLTTMISITCAGILHIMSVMIQAGDPALSQYIFILAFGIDYLNFFVLAELLNKLNILGNRGEVDGKGLSQGLRSNKRKARA